MGNGDQGAALHVMVAVIYVGMARFVGGIEIRRGRMMVSVDRGLGLFRHYRLNAINKRAVRNGLATEEKSHDES